MGVPWRRLLSAKPIRLVWHKLQPTRSISSLASDPFSPSTGRWLWNEQRKRQEHTRKFDISALKHAIVQAIGSTACIATVRLEKIAEGASNKVFLAVAGEQRLIVKIPDPVVPACLVTASEVATLEFLRSELKVPVPKVISWSHDSDNPVGCEYIIMEEAHGRALNTVWPELDIAEKVAVVDEVLSIQKRLLTTKHLFNGYGSLYFFDDAARFSFPRHLPVASSPTPKYCIGPLALEHFMHPALAASGLNCGPWHTPQDYLVSVAHSSLAHIESLQREDVAADRAFSFPTKPASDTSAIALCDMLRTLCQAIPHILPRSPDQHLPLIWHKDLHFGNLFVSPKGKITCIVDWQGTDILPSFLAARMPPFLDVEHDALLLELPEDFSEMPEVKRLELWERYRQSMLQQYYLADLKESVPDLAALLEDDGLAPIRRQVDSFSRISSRQDVEALLLRETLLRIQRSWSDFLCDRADESISCPINIEGDELARHQRDGRRYNEFQDLLRARNIPVADEGWVPLDDFTQRKDDLSAATREIINSLESEEELLEFNDRLRHWDLTDWQTM